MNKGLDYLNSLGLHKVKPGLERIKNLLKALGDPQDKIPGIIIAGTNGKGSVAETISSVLSAQGYKASLYTSPHLICITERIKINNSEISKQELSSIILEIKDAAEKSLDEQPSYFEVITAAAYLYFARKKVDFNILEVGMGGRWDATNVITPLVSVITNIFVDHTEYLGQTIKEIAAEKACIIRSDVPVVTGAKNEALEVINKTAAENNSNLYILGNNFSVTGSNTDDFEYKSLTLNLKHLYSNLKGKYQLNNIVIAIAVIEMLALHHNIKITEQAVRDGISKIDCRGRFEILRDKPPLILDSGHNPGAAKVLIQSLKELYPDIKFTFLIGMLDDKGHDEFIKTISEITDKMIITKVPSERTTDPVKLQSIAKKYIKNVEVIKDYKKAYIELETLKTPSCAAGSFYLIGAIKNLKNST